MTKTQSWREAKEATSFQLKMPWIKKQIKRLSQRLKNITLAKKKNKKIASFTQSLDLLLTDKFISNTPFYNDAYAAAQ